MNRIIINALAGIINAFVCPSVSALMAKWAPVNERTLLTAIAYAGSPLGISLGQPICGYICDRKWGWRGVYYVIFALNLVWYIWFYLYIIIINNIDYLVVMFIHLQLKINTYLKKKRI